MSLASLKKALKGSLTDKFEASTVIRWTASERYCYAAIKGDNGRWYTTATVGNSFVSKVLTFEDLVEVLSRSETSNVEVASTWEKVSS